MLRYVALIPFLVAGVCAQTANPAVAASQPLIVLIGPPLSGKTTCADAIATNYGIPSISIEDLIRDNAAELDRLRGQGVSLAEMRYDPAMSRYLRERLKTADLSRGLTLDGYPATLVQAEDLSRMFPDLKMKLIALRLQVPDDTIRKRAQATGRQSDRPEIIEQGSRITIARWMRFPITSPTPRLWISTAVIRKRRRGKRFRAPSTMPDS